MGGAQQKPIKFMHGSGSQQEKTRKNMDACRLQLYTAVITWCAWLALLLARTTCKWWDGASVVECAAVWEAPWSLLCDGFPLEVQLRSENWLWPCLSMPVELYMLRAAFEQMLTMACPIQLSRAQNGGGRATLGSWVSPTAQGVQMAAYVWCVLHCIIKPSLRHRQWVGLHYIKGRLSCKGGWHPLP